MLDAFIIERIRRRQEERQRSEGVPLRLPLQQEQDVPENRGSQENPNITGRSPTPNRGGSWRDSSPDNILENVLENSSVSHFSNTDFSI